MHNFKSKQHGAVIVEFAVILPLLAVLAIGVTELGTAFFALNTLNKAVRDGARLKTYSLDPYAFQAGTSATPLTNSQIQAQVQSVMNGLPAFYAQNTTTVTVEPAEATPVVPLIISGLEHARVSATYNHRLLLGQVFGSLLGLFGGSFNATIPLSAQATMRVQLP